MRPHEIFPSVLSSAPIDALIERRAATNLFDLDHRLSDPEIERLAELATRAPSAFNLQNWRLHAVKTPQMKARLRAVAFDQAKVEEAAVTFVVSGEHARAEDVEDRLSPAVKAGFMSAAMAAAWTEMARASYASDAGGSHDEAVRSATLLAATLMFAAEGRGLATAPMSGFDRSSVRSLLGLPAWVTPVLLVAVGLPRPGNWPQKPRRPLSDVLTLV